MRKGLIYGWLMVMCSFVMSNLMAQNNYQLGKVHIKVAPEYQDQFYSEKYPESFESIQYEFDLRVSQKFPNQSEIAEPGTVAVERIYVLEFSPQENPIKLSKLLMETGLFDYAEPCWIGQLAYTPNDPDITKQLYLHTIGAYDAWDITKGSSSTIIGVVDAGTDTNHLDLKPNFYRNTNDPINGVDDDQDGFVDNYYGWNFEGNNNNVQYSGGVDHGVQMSGAIAPATNNSLGVAGPGFNCRMMNIKVTNGSQVLYGYEGIKYAADHGCQVINCSWNFKIHSQFGEDMVNYATYDKGALVVAATGNQGKEDLNYPALYEAVLSVANVDYSGSAMSNSNYGYYVDLSAPGLNIWSTKGGNKYASNSGSSYSSAIVSGCAALLRSYKPGLTPTEVKSWLKASSTDIYANGQNSFYKNKFGAGMIHIGEALKFSNKAYPEWVKSYFTEPDNGVSEPGDTLDVLVELANYLDPSTGSYQLELSSLNGYAQVFKSKSTLRALATNDTASADSAFQLSIASSVPDNYALQLELKVIQNTDTFYYGFTHQVNPTYSVINYNDITTSLGTRGTYGWYEYPTISGKGVTYQGGAQLLHEGGLMIGNDIQNEVTVVDRLRGFQYVEQRDFLATRGISEWNPAQAPFALTGGFDDSNAKDELGVGVVQNAYAWKGDGKDNFVLFEYQIFSRKNKDLKDIYVGMMSDWDIGDYNKNRAAYDGQRYLAYSYEVDQEDTWCAMQLISPEKEWKTYAIDNISGGAGGIDITDNDVYSKEEKYYTLSTTRERAGEQTGGGDVLQVISSGPHQIPVGDTLTFQVAILVAHSFAELQESADSAYYLIHGRLPNSVTEPALKSSLKLYPNPSDGQVTIQSESVDIQLLTLTDLSGKVLDQKTLEPALEWNWDLGHLESSLYLIHVQTAQGNQVFKLRIY
ncbi:S8 family peptidase [bacterium SCSIO 12741]|nr:S8 family peptidase [bacterium SCSIO 12741]